jgi:uncharacterized protein
MKLDLDRTETGQSDLAVAGSFDLDFGPDGPAEARVDGVLRVDNLEGRFILRGELAATAPATCDRCLGAFALAFAVPVELVVLRDAGGEDEDGDTPVLHQRGGVVDLTDSVREALVLAVPQARLCRDDCRGLCVQCGTDLNRGTCDCADEDIDPRWDGLPD